MANDELNKILPDEFDPSRVESAIRVNSSPDGALGETWVFQYGSRWVSLYRASRLDEFTQFELSPDDPGDVMKNTFGARLKLYAKEGKDLELEVSAIDHDRVRAFFGVEPDDAEESDEGRLSKDPRAIAAFELPDEEEPPSADFGSFEPSRDEAEAAPAEERAKRSPAQLDDELEKPAAAPAARQANRSPAQLDDDELDDRLIELIQDGRKVAAIKLYREARGGTLSEGRDYVDDLMYAIEDDDHEYLIGEPTDEATAESHRPARSLDELADDPLLLGELIGYIKMHHRDVAERRLRDAMGLEHSDATALVQEVIQSRGMSEVDEFGAAAPIYDDRAAVEPEDVRSSSQSSTTSEQTPSMNNAGKMWRVFGILLIVAVVLYYLRFVH